MEMELEIKLELELKQRKNQFPADFVKFDCYIAKTKEIRFTSIPLLHPQIEGVNELCQSLWYLLEQKPSSVILVDPKEGIIGTLSATESRTSQKRVELESSLPTGWHRMAGFIDKYT